MDASEQADWISTIVGDMCTREDILLMLQYHPERANTDILVGEIMEGRADPTSWNPPLDPALIAPALSPQPVPIQRTLSSSSSSSVTSLSSASTSSSSPRQPWQPVAVSAPESEIDRVTDQVSQILGGMYERDKVREVVANHPERDNLEHVLNDILEVIDLRTVSGEWLRNASSGIPNPNFEDSPDLSSKDEDSESEYENLRRSVGFIIEEEVRENDRFRRGVISELLATEDQRELAFEVVEQLNMRRLKFTLDSILCVLRHHDNPSDVASVAEVFNRDFDAAAWFEKDEPLLEELDQEECTICFTEYSPADVYKVRCGNEHAFCYDCMEGSIRVALGDGKIPTCPWDGCEHNITEREVLHIFGEGEVQSKLNRLLLRAGLASLDNCVGCPTAGCENWLILPDSETKIQCYCDGCKQSFCSICRELYHYQATCEEMKEYTVKWIKWINNRAENMGKIKEIGDLQKRIRELEQDEVWKRQNLRCCPHCERPIEKLEGCDLMKCGKDYHGGNKQKGCGKRFRWTNALPYVSTEDTSQHLLDKKMQMQRNPDVISFGSGGNNVYGICDICYEVIEGVGFSCLNCPCINVCEKCEESISAHPGTHVFRVLGIEFIEEVEERRRSLLSVLRKAVSRKRASLLSAFSRSPEVTPENQTENPDAPVRLKKVRRGLLWG